MNRVSFAIILLVSGVNCVDYVESEISQLPKLFHLDDYDKCLAEQNGIFCLGEFQVYSDVEDHPTFETIKKYSHIPGLYNRTYLHRGYCLPTRCAGADANLTARFERCVDKWARHRHGLRARLRTLHYCQKYGEKPSNSPDTNDLAHTIFLYVLFFLMIMNFAGTVYDMSVENEQQKMPLLSLWSIRRNWKRLTMSIDHKDHISTAIEAFDGLKFILMIGVVYGHIGIFGAKMYQHNPRYMEKLLLSPLGAMTSSLSASIQAFISISNYLLACRILQAGKHMNIGFDIIPMFVLKRLFRILPVYLLVNGFAATWWASIGQGSMWPLVVTSESNTCRRKFWTMAGFVQNIVEPQNICLIQTWTVAVDMQLSVLMLTTILLIQKYHRHAVKILSALVATVLVATIYTTFANGYVPMYLVSNVENFRTYFVDSKSLQFAITSSNCLFSAATGIVMAYVNQELEHSKPKKRAGDWLHIISIPMVFVYAYCCFHFKQLITDPLMVTGMITVEKIYWCFFMALFVYGIQAESPVMRFLRWPILRPLSRMSLSVSMVHWCVNSWLVATRSTLQEYSDILFLLEFISTWVISHLLAVPLTLMVEYPIQTFLNKIIS